MWSSDDSILDWLKLWEFSCEAIIDEIKFVGILYF